MEDHEFDQLLAEALKAEPPAGMEQRVLAGIRPRNWAWWWLAPGLVAAGLAVLAVGVDMQPEESLPLKPPSPPVVVHLPRSYTYRAADRPRLAASRARIEERSQFPTPQPLSADEKALIAFFRQDPDRGGEALREMQKQSEAPIKIEPIYIPPLQSDGDPFKEKL